METATSIENVSSRLIETWLRQNIDQESLASDLRKKGKDEASVNLHIEAYKKALNQRRQFNAFLLLGIGAFIGFIGCILSLINPFPDYYFWILYGSTGIAACIIVGGLYALLEG